MNKAYLTGTVPVNKAYLTGTLFLMSYIAKHLKKVENTTLSCGVPELDIKNGQ